MIQVAESKVTGTLDELMGDPDSAWGAVTFAWLLGLIGEADYARRTEALMPRDDDGEAA